CRKTRERLGNVRHRDASNGQALYSRAAFGNRQQRHGKIDSRLRCKRSAEPGWQSGVVESQYVRVVQYGCVCLPRSGYVWQCRKEHSGGTWISKCERVTRKEHTLFGAREFTIPGRSLQPLQPPKLQPPGQLPGLPNLRPDHLRPRPTPHSVWVEAIVLSRRFTRINTDKKSFLNPRCPCLSVADHRSSDIELIRGDRLHRYSLFGWPSCRRVARTVVGEFRRTRTLDHKPGPRLP